MNRDLYVRRRSRRTDVRPGLLWLTLTFLLLALAGIGFVIVHALAGDWFDLKMESARVHVLEMLPKPDHPEFVPTPILIIQNAGIPTDIALARSSPTPTPIPVTVTPRAETPSAGVQNPTAKLIPPAPTQTLETTGGALALNPIRPAVELTGVIYEPQRFNNCGPTTLRMYLSFFGYTKETQVQIANVLKPNTNDRNVSPDEIVGYATANGFHALPRVNGSIDEMKRVLANNLPVMIEEGYDPPRAHEGWMGHYLLVTGYDANGILAQDSYNGPNQRVPWQEMDDHWRNFNRTYILLYTDAQQPMVKQIIGEDMDDATMYAKAAQRAQEEWNANPQDGFAAFNLGASMVGLGEYEAAAAAFDQARILKLPWRMLWYQFGPYKAYYQVGRFDEVIALADATLKPTGDLEESYYYKGLALKKLGRTDEARAALQAALHYNPNYHAAQQALAELGS